MRHWIKIIAALIAIVLLLWLGWSLVQGISGLLNGAGLNISEPDPMFAQEAELPVRPPELDDQELPPDRPTLDQQVFPEGAPVDKTARQLIEEAEQRDRS